MDQILSGPTAFALHRIPPQYRALLPSVPFIGAPACWRTVLKESLFRTLIQPPLYCLRQTRSACSGAKNLKRPALAWRSPLWGNRELRL